MKVLNIKSETLKPLEDNIWKIIQDRGVNKNSLLCVTITKEIGLKNG